MGPGLAMIFAKVIIMLALVEGIWGEGARKWEIGSKVAVQVWCVLRSGGLARNLKSRRGAVAFSWPTARPGESVDTVAPFVL